MAILNFATSPNHWNTAVNGGTITAAGDLGPYMQAGSRWDSGDQYALNFPSQTEVWFSFYLHVGGTQQSQSSANILFRNGGTTAFRVIEGASQGIRNIEMWNGASYVSLGSFVYSSNTTQRLDIGININASGYVQVWKNGIVQVNYSGDTTLHGQAGLTNMYFFDRPALNGSVLSAVFVADEDTRAIQAQDLRPTGNGNYTAWTGDYTAIDELTAGASDFISTTSADALETVTKTALNATFDSASWDVVALGVKAEALRAATGPQNLQLVCRSGTTDGVSPTKALDIVYNRQDHIFALDPNTAAAWTFANLNSAEIGVKSIT